MQDAEISIMCTECLLSAKHCSQCFTCMTHLTERRPCCWDCWAPADCSIEMVGWQNARNTVLNNDQKETWPLGPCKWLFILPNLLSFPHHHFNICSHTNQWLLSPLIPCSLQLDKPLLIAISWKAPPWASGTTHWVSEQSCHWGQGMAQGRNLLASAGWKLSRTMSDCHDGMLEKW